VSAATFQEAVEVSHAALQAMARGDSGPSKQQWSRRGDETLANPLGPAIVGWDNIAREGDRVAAMRRSAGTFSFKEVSRVETAELGYLVGIERFNFSQDGTTPPVVVALRVTTIFRREDEGWQLVHRHADRVAS
jgi:ketosteroid isomerase-like protein